MLYFLQEVSDELQRIFQRNKDYRFSNSIDELSTILVGLNASRILLIGNTRLNDLGYIDKIRKSIEKQSRLKVGAVYLGTTLPTARICSKICISYTCPTTAIALPFAAAEN